MKNPFRYRGYYYDFETGLYYLNSRYYDPETGRFVNADDISTIDVTKITTNGLNLYAYCLNKPVNEVDENGYFLTWLLGLAIAAFVFALANTAIQAGTDVINYAITGKWESSWEDYLGAFLGGLAGGITFVLSGFNIGLTMGIMSGVETLSTSLLTNLTGKTNASITSILIKSIASGLFSGLMGHFFNGTKIAGATTGRNSFLAIFKSGISKLVRQNATRMSLKVLIKGFVAIVALKSTGTLLSGVSSGIIDWIKFLFEDKGSIGYV